MHKNLPAVIKPATTAIALRPKLIERFAELSEDALLNKHVQFRNLIRVTLKFSKVQEKLCRQHWFSPDSPASRDYLLLSRQALTCQILEKTLPSYAA